MKIAIVQGTRPEIIKNYSIVRALRDRAIPHVVLHTDQHTADAMRDRVYADMGYAPDDSLGKPARIGVVIEWLQQAFASHGVSHVLVNGDTAAALAAAVASLYADLPLSHVEAGLRAHDGRMLEERNRIMVDAVASHLFAYTEHEVALLRNHADVRGEIHLEGNTTVDVVHDFAARVGHRQVEGDYIFLTLHRRELTDDSIRFAQLLDTLSRVADELCTIVFPVHPRTADALERHGLWGRLSPRILTLEPQPVFESLALQTKARLVATDSGCVQEEAYILGTPCVTLRENTERHLTLQHGANRLTGFEPENVVAAMREAFAQPRGGWPDIYGASGAGARIIDRLTERP